MKIKVAGSNTEGKLIKGPIKIGKEIVIAHKGKVEVGIVIRTKDLTPTKVRFGAAAVQINGKGVVGPISKGLDGKVKAKANMTY